jgi:hypothetical protein
MAFGFHEKNSPSPRLLSALQSKSYSVKPASQCKCTTGGAFDVTTHKRGLLFSVTDVKLTSSGAATVRADVFKDGKAGNDTIYTLANMSGRWHVAKCTIKAIF